MQPVGNAWDSRSSGWGVGRGPALTVHWLETKLPAPVMALLIGAAMKWFAVGHPEAVDPTPAHRMAGIVLAQIAGLIAVAAFVTMARARTTINPFSPTRASHLVTAGVFRWSRNPLYLSLLMLLVGYAIRIDSWQTWLAPLAFVAYVTRFQIIPEERYLQIKFGEAFDQYRTRTRRWI
jgi:protein-S-isoprenylcysteine O-methyltransferase Ste14